MKGIVIRYSETNAKGEVIQCGHSIQIDELSSHEPHPSGKGITLRMRNGVVHHFAHADFEKHDALIKLARGEQS